MAWLRLYEDILDDPKIQMLSDRAFRMLINLWCLAKRSNGIITDNVSSLAFSLRWPVGKVRDTLQALISAGLIDRVSKGYEPHNWGERQYDSDSAAERMRAYRLRQKETRALRNASRNSDVLDTETEQNRTEETPLPPIAFDDFWNKFPTEPIMSRPVAIQEWDALTPQDQAQAITAIPGLKAFYAKDKSFPKVSAATFLRDRRFEGFVSAMPDPAKTADAKDRADRLLKRGIYAEAAE